MDCIVFARFLAHEASNGNKTTCLVSIGSDPIRCSRRAFTRSRHASYPRDITRSRNIGAKAQSGPGLRGWSAAELGRDAPLAGRPKVRPVGRAAGGSVGQRHGAGLECRALGRVRAFCLAPEGCGMAGLPRQRPGHRAAAVAMGRRPGGRALGHGVAAGVGAAPGGRAWTPLVAGAGERRGHLARG
mgnify:CR=1 FL=1